MSRTFTHKGYGRIYCESVNDVISVHNVIKKMDEKEYEEYMPKDLVAPFSEYPEVVYIGKFSDLCIDAVTAECWKLGIKIWVFDNGRSEYPQLSL